MPITASRMRRPARSTRKAFPTPPRLPSSRDLWMRPGMHANLLASFLLLAPPAAFLAARLRWRKRKYHVFWQRAVLSPYNAIALLAPSAAERPRPPPPRPAGAGVMKSVPFMGFSQRPRITDQVLRPSAGLSGTPRRGVSLRAA